MRSHISGNNKGIAKAQFQYRSDVSIASSTLQVEIKDAGNKLQLREQMKTGHQMLQNCNTCETDMQIHASL